MIPRCCPDCLRKNLHFLGCFGSPSRALDWWECRDCGLHFRTLAEDADDPLPYRDERRDR